MIVQVQVELSEWWLYRCRLNWVSGHCTGAGWTECVVIVQVQVKSTVKAWSDLYVNFVRLSALVANAEPNIACEELMSSIRSFTDQSTTDVCLSLCLYFFATFLNSDLIAYR